MIDSQRIEAYFDVNSPELAQALPVFSEATTLVRQGAIVCVRLNGYTLSSNQKDGDELWSSISACFNSPGEFRLQDGSFRLSPDQCLPVASGRKQLRNVHFTYANGLKSTALNVLAGCDLLLDGCIISGSTAHSLIAAQAGSTVTMEQCKLAGSVQGSVSQSPLHQTVSLRGQAMQGLGCSVSGRLMAQSTDFTQLHVACAVSKHGHAELTCCSVSECASAYQVCVLCTADEHMATAHAAV